MPAKRVLIVDDDADVAEVVKVALEITAGWEVTLSASGQAGFYVARSEHPDLVLLDLMMPEMDGIATLTTLRADPETASIPVIMMTARVMESNRRVLESLDVQGVIAKPFDPVTIAGELANLLGWEC